MFVTSTDGVIIQVGGRIEQLLGLTERDLLGRKIVELVAPAAKELTGRIVQENRVGSYESATESLLRGVADLAGVFGRRLEDGSLWHHGMEHHELRALAVSRAIPSDVLALSIGLLPGLSAVLAARLEAVALAQEEPRGLLELLGAERLAPFDGSRYGWMADVVREDRTAAAIAARVRREDLG